MVRTLEVQARYPARPRWTLAFGVDPLRADARSWYLGARGEAQLAREVLDRLPGDWQVLHSIGVGDHDSDIDHLLVGPAGVITVNTKNHWDAKIWVSGRLLMVNGHRQQYIPSAEFEAQRVRTALSRCGYPDVPVHSAIVLANVKQLTVKTPPRKVAVLREARLRGWLRRLPVAVPPERLADLKTGILHLPIWRDDLIPPALRPGVVAAFNRLHRHHRLSLLARAVWLALLLIVIVGAGMTLLPGALHAAAIH